MVDVYYLGHSCFRIKGKKTSIVIDPYDVSVGLKLPKDLTSDIVLSTHDHPGHNNVSAVSGSPIVITGPGEYEIKEVTVFGESTFHDEEKGKKYGENTIFKFSIDKINFLHLGDLGHDLKIESSGDFNNIDVLMIPIGDDTTINSKEAMEIIAKIEPLIVLPMHYKTDKHTDKYSSLLTMEDFKKKSSAEFQKISGKLSLTSEKLPEQTTYYVFE
jgi:L-ascorbate metabolism protein UlaG (beta-lactamase superfamily)